MTSPTSPGPKSYLGFLFWHLLNGSARTWTPALMLHLTNPCAKRKVLSLTKPNSKIYKTKSLGNYITIEYPYPLPSYGLNSITAILLQGYFPNNHIYICIYIYIYIYIYIHTHTHIYTTYIKCNTYHERDNMVIMTFVRIFIHNKYIATI